MAFYADLSAEIMDRHIAATLTRAVDWMADGQTLAARVERLARGLIATSPLKKGPMYSRRINGKRHNFTLEQLIKQKGMHLRAEPWPKYHALSRVHKKSLGRHRDQQAKRYLDWRVERARKRFAKRIFAEIRLWEPAAARIPSWIKAESEDYTYLLQ
jgi:hypothetical protein